HWQACTSAEAQSLSQVAPRVFLPVLTRERELGLDEPCLRFDHQAAGTDLPCAVDGERRLRTFAALNLYLGEHQLANGLWEPHTHFSFSANANRRAHLREGALEIASDKGLLCRQHEVA